MTAKTSAKRSKKAPNAPWRQRLSLTAAVTLVVAAAIFAAGTAAGYYTLTVIYKNKLIDTWAIMFLELEQQSIKVADDLKALKSPSDEADLEFQITTGGKLVPVKGNVRRILSFQDLGFDTTLELSDITAVEYAGESFLAKRHENFLSLFRIPRNYFAGGLGKHSSYEATAYLLTRQGKLVATNNSEVAPISVVARPLVQKFIGAPLSLGQLEFRSASGEAYYGFFREIGGTNLIMFSEVPFEAVLATIRSIMGRFVGVVLIIFIVTLGTLQVPVMQLTKPLRELATLTTEIGRGNLAVAPKSLGFGEAARLVGAFKTMAENLLLRDQAIHRLMREQTEKVRLEDELKVAQGIQANLLLGEVLPAESRLDIKAEYIPATECAGDWYGYHYNKSGDETVVAIADVSGHGAGASMFTAIIAGVFDRYRGLNRGAWPLLEFAHEANGAMLRLGRGEWHATMLVARYHAPRGVVDFVFAGHCPPVIVYPGKEAFSRVLGPSAPLGVDAVPNLKMTSIPFPAGAKLLLFTDGLTEARNPSGRSFGEKRLAQEFLRAGERNAGQTVTRLVTHWASYRAERAATDDTCIVVMRAA